MCNRAPAFLLLSLTAAIRLVSQSVAQPATASASFTRLRSLLAPKIIDSAEPYPGQYQPDNLFDHNLVTEYSSNGKGTNTFIEVDFGTPVLLSAFRHVERNDPATVASSELTFLGVAGNVVTNFLVTHVNQRAGITFFVFPTAVTAQRVRWRITSLGAGLATVGGAELGFLTSSQLEALPSALAVEAKPLQLLERNGESSVQRVRLTLDYPYAEGVGATLRVEGIEPRSLHLRPGTQSLEISVPAVETPRQIPLKIDVLERTVLTQGLKLEPVRPLEIFLLPHSHVDIGYTALQADVEKKQNSNIETGLRLAKATADYPEGARFKWNTEVLWPVENYLREATAEKREAFIAAVRADQIGLDALYGNTLTGLCRPEELLNLMGYATRLSELCGVPVESAMISDVPGYTWSTVSAMAQAGVRYFSFAPNYFDRMGGTMKEWQNRPFWWKGPDGQSRVLCWCPSRGYALGHLIGDGEALARFIPEYLIELETNSYPYDITYLRWNVHGDNGSPDEKLSDVVRDWNARYVYPKLIISTTANAFRKFEKQYGKKLPEFSGDYTPYWEDGAASSAFETALNRSSDERLVQAETLWAIRDPGPFPASEFQAAWRDALLYSEHTWGAHNSISQPDLPFVREQWTVKQAFALDADRQSKELLRKAASPRFQGATNSNEIDVYNTCSWTRTDLVTLPPDYATAGDQVTDQNGKPVPSQRLSSGELVFVASNLAPFSAARFRIEPGSCPMRGGAKTEPTRLISSHFFIRIDEHSGAIKNLFSRSLGRELVDPKSACELNDYLYLPGSDLKGLQSNSPPRITQKEKGPLLASLLVESDAPGCKRLSREVRVIDGLDRVEFINTIEKLPVRAKEGVHFGWGFLVPAGTMRMDVGWAEITPEINQIPASCKNWFSVQRWVDISNDRFGVTWSPIDAPLVEVGSITANLVGSQTDYRAWVQHLKPSQTFYSWVMNNHWHTNYRAEQEGTTVFRFALRAHYGFAAEDAAQFGVSCSQPLLALKADGAPVSKSRLRLSSEHVVVSTLKPSDDGKGLIVRLFGASGKAEKVRLLWSNPTPEHLWLSDTSERPKMEVGNLVDVPGWGIVTLRAE